MKTAFLVLLLSSIAVGTAHAAEPQTLAEGSWVCRTPESYDQAVEIARHLQENPVSQAPGDEPPLLFPMCLGMNDRSACIWTLRLSNVPQARGDEPPLCMVVDDEALEDLMAPFVKVLSRQGDKVKVSFTIEFYKRIQYLHRKITRVTFAGWTDAKNLRNYYQ